MKIVFRVDSSSMIGGGHLMRCLSLAKEFKNRRYEVFFVCRALNGNLTSNIDFPVLILPKNKYFKASNFYLNCLGASQEQDAHETINIIPQGTDLIIVDNYAIDKLWHAKLRRYVNKIMVIDDLADREFDCDILLNQNLAIQKYDYTNKIPQNCKLLIGCNYALLRSEFRKIREKSILKRENTKKIKNILISMGANDSTNKTFDILQNIHDEFEIVVILGLKSQYNEMIKDYANSKNNVNVIIDSKNVSELMFNADLAIGAGGSTSWERCCLALPTLLYVLGENQMRVASSLQKAGAVKIVQDFKADFHQISNNLSIWHSMSKNAKNICDGYGVKRIKI